MQRKPMIGDEPNKYSLNDLPLDKSFWQEKDLTEIRTLLKDALILKRGNIALPEHADLQALMTVISQRAIDLVDDALVESASRFLDSSRDIRNEKHNQGEMYLQIMAVLNFYAGHYEHAAKPLAALGNAYFLCDRVETNLLSAHFNLMAALAFREADDVSHACQHYNQYLANNGRAIHTPEDVQMAVAYLLEHHSLVSTDALLVVLERMIEKCSDQADLRYGLTRQLNRAEEQVMYADLDRRKIAAALQETRQQLESLKLVASINQQSAQQVTQTNGTLFGAKAGAASTKAEQTEAPRLH